MRAAVSVPGGARSAEMSERSFSTPICTAVWAKAGVATSSAAIEASSNLPFCIFCFLPWAAPRARFVCLNAEISMQLPGVRFDFVVRDGVDHLALLDDIVPVRHRSGDRKSTRLNSSH